MVDVTFKWLKAFCGLIAFFICIPMSIFSVYCAYLGFFHFQIYPLIYFVALMTYQLCFAKKSENYINLMKYLEIENYFEARTCVLEEKLDDKNVMIGFHPHCVWHCGALLTLNLKVPNFRFLASRFILSVPFVGMMIRFWDTCPVNPSNMKKYCQNGENVALLPGAFEEATLTSRYHERVYIKQRKGFIKYALQYGYKVHIGYTFNECRLFWTFDPLLKWRLLLNKVKMIGVFFFSPYFVILPDPNIHLHTVISKGLVFPKIDNPTKEDVEKYHNLYIDEMKNLFNRYKDKYKIDKELEIF